MNLQLDQVIFTEINNILSNVQLNSEMLQLIKSSLKADCSEPFPWAHLTLLSCECVNGISVDALPGAIGMELFALAADIFDDVQDQDNDDQPWRKLPDANAINLALCLLILSYEAISNIPDKQNFRKVFSCFNQTGISASNGQFREFLYNDREQVTLEQYFELIKQKSGSLTACACKIGAILGDAPETLLKYFVDFGVNFGISCQIRNDLNDFLDFAKKNDFVNKTKTLPYVYLLNILQGESAERFRELTQNGDKGLRRFKKDEQEYLKKIAVDEGVVHYCKVMYEIFRQKAEGIILDMPVPEGRKEKMIKLVGESV